MSEEMQYGRGPDLPGWPDITAKLKAPSGWRLRNDSELLLDGIQTDIGAALSHHEKKQWANMLVCIEDAAAGMVKLRAALQAVLRERAPKPARTESAEPNAREGGE